MTFHRLQNASTKTVIVCCVLRCDVCSMNWPKVVKGAVYLDLTLSMHKETLLEVGPGTC